MLSYISKIKMKPFLSGHGVLIMYQKRMLRKSSRVRSITSTPSTNKTPQPWELKWFLFGKPKPIKNTITLYKVTKSGHILYEGPSYYFAERVFENEKCGDTTLSENKTIIYKDNTFDVKSRTLYNIE